MAMQYRPIKGVVMLQVSVNRRQLMIFTAVIALFVSVAWVGAASRASAASATPVVYVATGSDFPDALGAASAAAVGGGPVLLVTKTTIPVETAAELVRLAPDIIYVAGGTGVVSDAVFDALKAYAASVVRVAGANRYATAAAVSESAFPVAGGGSAALEARVAALEAEIDALQAMLSGVTRNGDTLEFSGMNLQIVNGMGLTASTNGLGNVIFGYNEDTGEAEARTGSHYLVVGIENDWTKWGGMVAGQNNNATGQYATVTGGAFNTASDSYSSVSGGSNNTASGFIASVTGGFDNTASGGSASVTGGEGNAAVGQYSSVTGGLGNQVVGAHDTVVGGDGKINISWEGAIAIGEGFWDPAD